MSRAKNAVLPTVVCSYLLTPAEIVRRLRALEQGLGVRFAGVVCSNKPLDGRIAPEGWQFLQGSNDDLDFSAYIEGTAELVRRMKFRAALVINDTIFVRHNAQYILATILRYRESVERCEPPAIAGKSDFYDNVCYANPWNGLPLYISSFAFLLNGPAISILQGLTAYAESDLGSITLDILDNEWGRGLSVQFREYLRTHLDGIGTSLAWYQLTSHKVNRALISQKARCVYFEHRLSGNIGANGIIFNIFPWRRMKAKFFVLEQMSKLKRQFASSFHLSWINSAKSK